MKIAMSGGEKGTYRNILVENHAPHISRSQSATVTSFIPRIFGAAGICDSIDRNSASLIGRPRILTRDLSRRATLNRGSKSIIFRDFAHANASLIMAHRFTRT